MRSSLTTWLCVGLVAVLGVAGCKKKENTVTQETHTTTTTESEPEMVVTPDN